MKTTESHCSSDPVSVKGGAVCYQQLRSGRTHQPSHASIMLLQPLSAECLQSSEARWRSSALLFGSVALCFCKHFFSAVKQDNTVLVLSGSQWLPGYPEVETPHPKLPQHQVRHGRKWDRLCSRSSVNKAHDYINHQQWREIHIKRGKSLLQGR